MFPSLVYRYTRTQPRMAWYSSSTSSIVRPFSCVLFIILYCGNGVIVDAIFTNLWAVKVRGSQQEAEELAHRHGFSYDKHVSFTLVMASLLSPCSMLPFVREILWRKTQKRIKRNWKWLNEAVLGREGLNEPFCSKCLNEIAENDCTYCGGSSGI